MQLFRRPSSSSYSALDDDAATDEVKRLSNTFIVAIGKVYGLASPGTLRSWSKVRYLSSCMGVPGREGNVRGHLHAIRHGLVLDDLWPPRDEGRRT